MFWRLLGESFRRQRRRKALAGIAILLGTTAVTAMLALATTIGDRIHKELAVYGANIIVTPAADALEVKVAGVAVRPASGGAYLREGDLEKLKGIFWANNITGVSPELSFRVPVRLGDGSLVSVPAVGFWFDHAYSGTIRTGVGALHPLWKVDGRWPAGEGEVAVGVELARRLGVRVGDVVGAGVVGETQVAFGNGGKKGNGEGQKQIPFGNDNQSAFGNDNQSAFGNDNQSAFGNDNQSAFGNDNQSAFGNDNQSAFGNDNQSAFGNDNQSALGNDNQSALGNENQSAFGNDNQRSGAESAGVAGKVGETLTVSGIVTAGNEADGEILLPLALAQRLAGLAGAVSRVEIGARTKPEDAFARKDPDTLTPKLREVWYCRPYANSIAYQIQEAIPGSRAEQVRRVEQSEGTVLARISGLMWLVSGAALLAAGFAVSAAMATAVLERRGEIGLMRSLGAGRGAVAMLFYAETGVLALVAGGLGYLAGSGLAAWLGARIFEDRVGWRGVFNPVLLPVVVGLGLAVAMLGSTPSIRAALRMNPAGILREDG